MISATGESCPVGSKKREVRLQQHRSIDVGDATLECALCGLGAPVVLLANAGCSTGYFDHLARALVTGEFQTISINMRGVGGSCGSLDGATLHDLAGDVAGVIKAIGCGPVHLVGWALFPLPQLYTPVGTLSVSAMGHGPPGSPTRANDRLGSTPAVQWRSRERPESARCRRRCTLQRRSPDRSDTGRSPSRA